MKVLYNFLLFLMIFICSVGSVCATDTDNITVDNSLSDVNSNVEIVEEIETSNINSNNDNLNNNVSNDNSDYCCGVVAFKEALKENGIDISLEEAKEAVKPNVNGSTSMQNIIDGAKAYNLTAYPVKLNANGLIFHMNLNGTGHWTTIDEFDNYMIIINKDPNCFTDIIGIKHGWKTGFIYKHGKWYVGSYKVPVHRR